MKQLAADVHDARWGGQEQVTTHAHDAPGKPKQLAADAHDARWRGPGMRDKSQQMRMMPHHPGSN